MPPPQVLTDKILPNPETLSDKSGLLVPDFGAIDDEAGLPETVPDQVVVVRGAPRGGAPGAVVAVEVPIFRQWNRLGKERDIVIYGDIQHLILTFDLTLNLTLTLISLHSVSSRYLRAIEYLCRKRVILDVGWCVSV